MPTGFSASFDPGHFVFLFIGPQTFQERQQMLNREAVDQTIGAMESDGKLKPEHAALVTMVQGLASSVDDEPQNASLWREFRAALETLRQIGLEDEQDDDEISLIIAALRGSAQVCDETDGKPADSRSRGRKAG